MTRKYQCSNEALGQPTLMFIDDCPDGGCYVSCGYCGFEFNEKNKVECPECNKDLVFPSSEW